MNRKTARDELRAAKQNGFCPFCFSRAERSQKLSHNNGCKIVSEAGITTPEVIEMTGTIPIERIWGITDIAREMSLTRSAIHQMKARYTKDRNDYPPFPDEICIVNDDQFLYDSEDVLAWFRATGRIDLEEGHLYDHRGYDVTDKKRRVNA